MRIWSISRTIASRVPGGVPGIGFEASEVAKATFFLVVAGVLAIEIAPGGYRSVSSRRAGLFRFGAGIETTGSVFSTDLECSMAGGMTVPSFCSLSDICGGEYPSVGTRVADGVGFAGAY